MKKILSTIIVFLLTITISGCNFNLPGISDYTVTFNLNGGELVSGNLEQKVSTGITFPEVKKDGYIFDGWDNDCKNITGNITVNAIWKENQNEDESFVVAFLLDGGKVESGVIAQTILNGGDAIPPIVTKEGYEFAGWDKPYKNIKEDTIIKAIWVKEGLTKYTVTFDLDGGILDSGLLTQQILKGEEAIAPTTSKKGYIFS